MVSSRPRERFHSRVGIDLDPGLLVHDRSKGLLVFKQDVMLSNHEIGGDESSSHTGVPRADLVRESGRIGF
jgi:hypothetical protein